PVADNSPRTIDVTFVVSLVGIHVSVDDPAAVDDASCGLGPVGSGPGNHPCRTIAQGITRAGQTGKTQLVVADGSYNEAVTLVNGISLFGGYRPDTWERHLATTNTVVQGVSSQSNNDRTIVA